MDVENEGLRGLRGGGSQSYNKREECVPRRPIHPATIKLANYIHRTDLDDIEARRMINYSFLKYPKGNTVQLISYIPYLYHVYITCIIFFHHTFSPWSS